MSKTTWHYNIVKEGDYYSLREVYIDHHEDKEDGVSWTDSPVTFVGDSREEVIESLETALKDAKNHKVWNVDKKKVEEKNEAS